MVNLSLNFETEDRDDRKLVGMRWGQSFKFLRIIRVREREKRKIFHSMKAQFGMFNYFIHIISV